jgi:uncharacterized protein involved in outer membrane biogenesis
LPKRNRKVSPDLVTIELFSGHVS